MKKETTPKTLHLTLTKRWFEMIRNGTKTEEYREVKEHWIARLAPKYEEWLGFGDIYGFIDPLPVNHFYFIHFTNGYGKDKPQMVVECKGITVGRGNPEWGAPANEDVFIIQLGAIIKTRNVI